MKSMRFDYRLFLLLVTFLCLNNAIYSQAKTQDLFPTDDLYFKSWGWQAALGGNYTIPLFGEENKTYKLGSDTVTHGRFTPKGQPGMMIEGGAFYLFDNPYVSYADAALRVNWFRGKEDFELASVSADNDTLSSQTRRSI